MTSALSFAYQNNPNLNAERANLRAIDELVPQALSGFRPQAFATGRVQSIYQNVDPGRRDSRTSAGAGVVVEQPLFRGFRNVNSVKEAESSVRAGRAFLRNVEQNILLDAVQAYMNVVRDTAIVQLRQNNVQVLDEELRATRDRFEVGEVTRTDVAQAEARRSGAVSELNFAQAGLMASRADFRRVIGREPAALAPTGPAPGIPGSLDAAIAIGLGDHPAIVAASYAEEASAFAIRVAEGTLLPSLTVQGSFDHTVNPSSNLDRSDSASVVLQLTVPIYQGGFEYSQVRQAKEIRVRRMLEVDVARHEVRAAIMAAWGSLEAATASIESARSQVQASEIALEGVRAEAGVGQRTTLDVLDADRESLDARVSLVVAERDRVVASYALKAAVGQLSAERLGLAVARYEPEVHYDQVRDRWFGLRTPSGQ